ncbi:MAG: prenyltransferase/squalene oxidase repeat-containing protein [Armatimonadota bacterium]
MIDLRTLDETLAASRARLLSERNAAGHWEGELSSSALSTATALFALHLAGRVRPDDPDYSELVRGGVRWLTEHRNADGGWGDTTLSVSNISTTALCWAALSAVLGPDAEPVRAAEAWLQQAAGSTEPAPLARAIADRYGKDRTFSVPILTMCALAGRLGKGVEGWRHVPHLPFELAACPHDWFRWLKLPVVSYALPALIAIGQAGHYHRPSWNPAGRLVRALAKPRTLRVLEEIQPEGGGFLEATPLTSFVAMSLLGAGEGRQPVVTRCLEFLVRSVRPDGSWPIDTNLATWVTTLSVNALAAGDAVESALGDDAGTLLAWLLRQQYREVHPYTRAAPGGWAWTDLPGGVPDADDTPGALLALRHLGPPTPEVRSAADAGVTWLLDLQNADGGMPTFCRGWGALPFDRSGADLTAHALLAWNTWLPDLSPAVAARVRQAIPAALRYLAREQRPDGAWLPLWFGNQHAHDDANPTYGTARVLIALGALDPARYPEVRTLSDPAVRWLRQAQNPDGSWGGERGVPGSIEETALGVHALAVSPVTPESAAALERGAAWLIEQTDGGKSFPASPIGFYFARLWYWERLYPLIFSVAALGAARKALGKGSVPETENKTDG